jgi:hypothetical protein
MLSTRRPIPVHGPETGRRLPELRAARGADPRMRNCDVEECASQIEEAFGRKLKK